MQRVNQVLTRVAIGCVIALAVRKLIDQMWVGNRYSDILGNAAASLLLRRFMPTT